MDSEKLNTLNLKVSYDGVSDVLYISFGDPRPGIATEVNGGDLVRTDPETNDVIGITIIDFRERFVLDDYR